MLETTPLVRYFSGECGSIGGAQALGLIADVAAPALPVANEEALIRRQPIDRLQGFWPLVSSFHAM